MINVNGVEINPTIFPDKTSQVWKVAIDSIEIDPVKIYWEFENEAEVFQLIQLVMLLRASKHHCNSKFILIMPYLPYGRQDKHVSNETTFALTAFSDVINNLKFDEVRTLDAHSGEFIILFNNASDEFPEEFIRRAMNRTAADIVAYPDKGACARYAERLPYKYVIGEKVRDQQTGWIKQYDLIDPLGHGVKGKKVLMIDDICDGGMTFILLARDLYKAGAERVSLYVTHGIFSKGLDVLEDSGIKDVFTHKGRIY